MAKRKTLVKSASSKKSKKTTKASLVSSKASSKGRQLTGFGQRLVSILQSKGMNDSDLAKALGIAQPNIHTLKYKTDRPRSATVMKIAKTLGIEPAALAAGSAVIGQELGMASGRESQNERTKVFLVIETKYGRQTVRLA